MNKNEFLINNGIDITNALELVGDMKMYDSLMGNFASIYNERIQKLSSYYSANNMESFAIEVHSLKSDSKYLGFKTLAEIAYQMEMFSKNNDSASVQANYQALVNEYNKIINICNEYLQLDQNSSSSDMSTAISEGPQLVSSNEVQQMTKTILVADDSPIICDFIKEIFNSEYEILMAKDGQEVVNIVSANSSRIAALLLDLNMPNVNGFQVLEFFKVNDLFSKIPVSIITGANDKDSINKAFTYPIVDMLTKPFNKETVKLIVEKTLNINK